MIKVNLIAGTAERSGVPAELTGLLPETLRYLQTALDPVPPHLVGIEFWPEADTTPAFDPETHQLGAESFELDAESKQVLVSRAVDPIPAEIIEQRRRAAIPRKVKLKQARLVLIEDDLFDDVEAFIESIADLKQRKKVRTQWEYSEFVERDKDLVIGIALALNLSEAQVDDLFIRASKILE